MKWIYGDRTRARQKLGEEQTICSSPDYKTLFLGIRKGKGQRLVGLGGEKKGTWGVLTSNAIREVMNPREEEWK